MALDGCADAGGKPLQCVRHRLLLPLATGLGYYLGAVLGVAASSMSEGIAIFWLPNGILLAALLLAPRRDWPLYLLAAATAEIVADLPTFTLAQALGFAAVNLFECLLAAWLLQRVARPFALDRLRHVVLFGLVLVFASGLAAVLGASIYSLSVPTTTSFWDFWTIWWMGDGMGVLLVTPLVLGWLQGRSRPFEQRHPLEAAALLALTLLLTIWVFSQVATDSFPRRPFLLFPLSLWAAARFGVRGAASIALLIAAIAITATLNDVSPLLAATPADTVLLLQEYLAVLVFSSLALAALLEELRERNESLRIRERAIEAINDGVVIMDARPPDLPIVFANPAFEATAGHRADEIPGHPLIKGNEHVVRDALREGKPARALLHEVQADGTESWNELRVAPVRDARGQVTHYVAIRHDMTEVKRNESELRAARDELDRLNRELEARVEARTHELQEANRRLEELASIDPLTGASNRRHFLEQAKAEISRAKRQGLPLSVIMLDIDFFKSINDRFGHEAGDQVLVALAATIHATLRGGDIFARMGGEEFIVMLPGQGLQEAMQMAERLRLLIAQSTVPGCPARITVSAGIAALENASEDIVDLLRRADQGLYRAKNQGRNQVCLGQGPSPDPLADA